MGYANRRPRPANGNFNSRVLKPAKKKSYCFVWGGALLLLLVAGGAAALCFCLSPEGEVQWCREAAEKGDAEVTQALDLGDFSNLQDARFCRRHGLDAKVVTDYDVHRRANVYKGSSEARRIEMPNVCLRMIVQYVECSNRIVEKSEIYVMNAEGDKGTVEFQRGNRAMATAVVDEISELSALSSEGNPIVSSSPNIMYRGYNKKLVNDSLVAAVSNVIKNHGGVVAIQWKTPKCFVSWHFLAMNGVYTVVSSKSDQIIRTNVFGNE